MTGHIGPWLGVNAVGGLRRALIDPGGEDPIPVFDFSYVAAEDLPTQIDFTGLDIYASIRFSLIMPVANTGGVNLLLRRAGQSTFDNTNGDYNISAVGDDEFTSSNSTANALPLTISSVNNLRIFCQLENFGLAHRTTYRALAGANDAADPVVQGIRYGSHEYNEICDAVRLVFPAGNKGRGKGRGLLKNKGKGKGS